MTRSWTALHLFTVTGKVTSDCLADCLEEFWANQCQHFPRVDTLVLNLDNGPECHSRRTQFMAHMVQFVERTGIALRLAYYPRYHSKYNPVERCWGVLEHHWNGSLLDSVETCSAVCPDHDLEGPVSRCPAGRHCLRNQRQADPQGHACRGGQTSAPAQAGPMVC